MIATLIPLLECCKYLLAFDSDDSDIYVSYKSSES